DVAIATAYVFAGWQWLALPDIPLSIFGGVIGVIAGFRNASAYARWWEARTIWGALVNHSRSFAREVLSMMGAPEASVEEQGQLCEMKRDLITLQIAYCHALRNALRGSPPWKDLAGLVPEQEIERLKSYLNVPLAIQQKIASLVAVCHDRGWVDSM